MPAPRQIRSFDKGWADGTVCTIDEVMKLARGVVDQRDEAAATAPDQVRLVLVDERDRDASATFVGRANLPERTGCRMRSFSP